LFSGGLFSGLAATEVGSDESGQNISIEAGGASSGQQFPCDGGHSCVVGAQFRWSDEQFDTFPAAHGGQSLSEGTIRSDSTPDAQAGVLQLSHCVATFFNHDFDCGSLESGGQIGHQFGRSAGELVWSGDPAGGVEHGGFESREAEVKFS